MASAVRHIAITLLRVFEVDFYINKSQIHYLTTQIHQSQCLAIIALLLDVGHFEKRTVISRNEGNLEASST